MAKKNIGTAEAVTGMTEQNSVFIEVGGSLRRISLGGLREAISKGGELVLSQIAWGIPIKDGIQTSPEWGMVGNQSAYAEYKSHVGRYLVTAEGKAAKLQSNNSSVFADGTALTESKGSVMVIAPELHFLFQEDAERGYPVLWMSPVPLGGHSLGNASGGRHICVGAYKGSLYNSKLVSRSGVDFDISAKTINAYWNAAQSFGKSWGLTDVDVWKWICMMCLCESKGNANIQSSIGQGVGGNAGVVWGKITASTTLKKTGLTKSLGDATGKVTISDTDAQSDSTHVSVLGVEDFWNLQWEFIQGCFFGKSGNSNQTGTEIFLYEGNRMPTETELSTHPSGAYRRLTRLTTNGYVKEMLKGEHFDLFAKTLNGGSNSEWSDYYYGNKTGQVLLVGGRSAYGAYSGPFSATSVNAWSYSTSYIGARPAYYGQVQFVDGRDL